MTGDGTTGLEATRRALRQSLGQVDSAEEAGDGVVSEFPRSAIMRAVTNPDVRWLWVGGLGIAAAVAGRRLPLKLLTPWLARAAVRSMRQR